MSMAPEGSRESLKFKVQGNIHSFLEWGHEYVRYAAYNVVMPDEQFDRSNAIIHIPYLLRLS
jgi:hypothetical protein